MARKKLDLSWMDQAPKPKQEEDKKARGNHRLSHHHAPLAAMAAPGGVTKTTGTALSVRRTTYATPPKTTHRREVDHGP